VSPDGNYLYDYKDKSWYSWSFDPESGGSWVSTSPPAGITAPPLQWAPGDANHQPDKPKPSGDGPPPPKIPGGSGSSGPGTTVDTPSLDLFVRNIKALVDPVNGLLDTLKKMKAVQPGAFYHADLIRANITGKNGDAGLRAKYDTVCSDLGNGLVSLHQAVSKISGLYKSTEEANKGTAQDVQKYLGSASGYFSGIVTDGGSGSGSGSGSSGS
jgi:hypothetical protein